MGSSSSSFSLRILLISASVVAVAMAMKFSVPLMLNFVIYDIPVIWSVILSWLRPPYLYVLINGIIITIAASSRFYHHHHHENQYQPLVNPTEALPPTDLPSELLPMSIQPNFGVLEHPPVVYEIEDGEMEEPPVLDECEAPVIDVETMPMKSSEVVKVEDVDADEFVISRSMWDPPQPIRNRPSPEKIKSEFILPVREMPLVSSRFSHQRKTAKTNPEGARSLRVSKPRKHETLESTWKTITDGRHMPLTRHLRKADNFENHHHDVRHWDAYPSEHGSSAAAADTNVVKEEETFNDSTEYVNKSQPVLARPPSKTSSPLSGGKLRKEGSLSHDELNRRVEAFIKKFNDEMRLQRQESLNRYMEMINRGAH